MGCPAVAPVLSRLLRCYREGLAATGIENVAIYVLTVFIGFNFIAELAVNVLCCPIAVTLLRVLRSN